MTIKLVFVASPLSTQY